MLYQICAKSFLIFLHLYIFIYKSEESKLHKSKYKCVTNETTCTFANVVLNLTDSKWQPIADDPSIIETIIFTDCIVQVVTKDICDTFPLSQNLVMNKIGIKIVLQDAFHNCSNLVRLYMNENEIEKLYQSTFLFNRNLIDVNLYDNRISHIDIDFTMLSNLKYLNLGRNNLTIFTPEFVKFNKNLEVLNLNSNDLSDLEVEKIVQYLPMLKQLDINYNEFSCVRATYITKILFDSNIIYSKSSDLNNKVRYYNQINLKNLTCNSDLEWMASTYRKENLILKQDLTDLKKEQMKIIEVLDEIDQILGNMEDDLLQLMKKRSESVKKLSEKCLNNQL